MRTHAARERWYLLGLSTAGTFIAAYLLAVHRSVKLTGTFDGGLCQWAEGFNCATVAQSSYSEIFGVPIAALAIGFYLAVGAITLTQPRFKNTELPPHLVSVAYFAASLFSMALLALGVFKLGSLCLGCVGLYGVNILGLVAAWRWAEAGPFRALMAVFRDRTLLFSDRFAWSGAGLFLAASLSAAWLSAAGSAPPVDDAMVAEFQTQRRVPADILQSPVAYSSGPEDAPVVLVEFSDFQCPYCARLAESVGRLKEKYGDELRVEFRHLPLPHHAHAKEAAKAAVCAGEQDKFWPMHDLLFAEGRNLSSDKIRKHGAGIQLDAEAFERCMSAARVEAVLEHDKEAAQMLALTASPSFFINGRLFVGARPFETLDQLVQAALYEAKGMPVSTKP